MTEKKIKQRICISCSEKKDKADLFRVVKTPDGELVIDDTGKVNGHGSLSFAGTVSVLRMHWRESDLTELLKCM